MIFLLVYIIGFGQYYSLTEIDRSSDLNLNIKKIWWIVEKPKQKNTQLKETYK